MAQLGMAPRRLVLISSIAVYRDSRGKDEQSPMETEGLPPYGANRLQLEQWVREDFPDAMIVRLPALYGKGLKKNFLYDLHTLTPALLKPEKYTELAARSALVAAGFTTVLALQVFFNIGVVTNFLPSTGISLPFFSYGGTALWIQMAEMGVILSVSRQNKARLK